MRGREREGGGREKKGEMMGGGTDGAKRRRAATYNWLQAQISDGPGEAGKERGKKGRKEKSPRPHCPLAFLQRAIDRLRLQPG